MFKLLALIIILLLVIAMVPSVKVAVAWVLAFLTLLMLGDLLLSRARKLWHRLR